MIKNLIQKAREIIAENIYMVISSASLDGKPWISPVFFAYDDEYNLFWVSNKDSKHSNLIRENGQVAIVIFDSRAPEGEGDGVYFESEAHEVSDENEILGAMDILNKRVTKDEFKVKEIGQVRNDGVWRIYKVIPVKTYKLSDGEYVNGQYIDTRVEIDLKQDL